MKILTKITVYLFIQVILALLVVEFIGYNYSKSSLENLIGENQFNLAKETLDKIDRALYRGYTDIQIIAGYDELEKFLNKDNPDKDIITRLDEYSVYTGPWDMLSIINKSGEVVISTEKKEIGENLEEDPNNYYAFEQSLKGNVYYSEVLFSEKIGKPTIIFSSPIRDRNLPGKPVIGVLIGHFAWPAVIDILSENELLTTLYTQDGTVVGANDPDLNQKILNTNHNDSAAFQDALLNGRINFGIYPGIVTNIESLISHAHQKGYMGYKGNGYVLFLETPTKSAFAPSIRLRNTLILVFLVIGIMIFMAIIFTSISFTASIRKLYDATKKLQEGDYSTRLNISSKDEVEELGKAFNETIEKLEKLDVERKQIDKAKSEFLNIVSHELKTPLTVIYAYLDIIDGSKDLLSESQLQGLDAIRRNSDRLKELINNILERSRIDSGKFELLYSDIDLKYHVERIVKNLKIIADKYENEVVIRFNHVPKKITIDLQRFEEILNNLLSNALKFTKKGKVLIEVNSKDGFVIIKVTDQGIGIPKEKIKNLFQKFYQVDSGLSRKYEGSGLGLSITKDMVELLGGKIWVESAEGKGSVFTFTVPIKPNKNND
jgi:signal transduction histidine kinase